jgi:integrase
MNAGTMTLLREWKVKCVSDYVVEYKSNRVKSITNAFRQAVKRAGFEKPVTRHDLRHTAAVHMAASGCEMARISQYMGHSSVQVTERTYARFAPNHLRREAEAVDFLTADEGLPTATSSKTALTRKKRPLAGKKQ